MPKLNPNARLVVVVFLIAFCLMMRFGDHNLYLVD
jgi:type IV secretory pathway VirB2 component (pilin)